MTTVDFFTFCCKKDVKRLAAPGELEVRVKSHGYNFDNIAVIRQRLCDNFNEYRFPCLEIRSEDHPNILQEYGFPEYDALAEELTHGPEAAHYYKWHCINHLIGLKVSKADYIVFSDCDCRIYYQVNSWVQKGIEILKKNREVLIVSPSDGGDMHEKMLPGNVRLTQNVSQQLFICERERLKNINWCVPWDKDFSAPGGPMQEFYEMGEGRMWRWMNQEGLYRAILPEQWRYWHDMW